MEATFKGPLSPRSLPSTPRAEGTDSTTEGAGRSPFRLAEVFFAKVDKVLSPGLAAISAKGSRFTARMEVPLREGGVYSLKVEAVHPHVVLKTVPAPENRAPGILEIWAQGGTSRGRLDAILQDLAQSHRKEGLSEGLRAELRRLQDLLQAMLYPGPDRADGKWLKQAFTASGIFWEARLYRRLGEKSRGGLRPPIHHNDLKGLLTKLLGMLEGAPSRDDEQSSFMGKAQEALSCIEDQQLLNLHGGGQGWYWFLPGSRDTGFRQAEFFGKSLPGTGEHHLTLVMEFSRLGRVEADLTLTPSGLRAVLRAGDREKATMISNHLGDLETSLRKRVGIPISGLACAFGEAEGPPKFIWDPGTSPAIDIVI